MKQLVQPSKPMYVVFGRGYNGELYFIHMKSGTPGGWKIDGGELKGEFVHSNHDFYVDTAQWHKMMPLLTEEWCKKHSIISSSLFTCCVSVKFTDESPKPKPVKGWKLKILECSRSYKNRSITVVVNTGDSQKAFRTMMGANTMLHLGCWSWRCTAVNYTAQTCKLVFSLSDGEDLTLHVKRLLELYS